jgi:hypothetical protein
MVLADMSTSEMVETLPGEALYDYGLMEEAEDEIGSVESYLVETDEVEELLDLLTEEEARELAGQLEELMKESTATSGMFMDVAGKEC